MSTDPRRAAIDEALQRGDLDATMTALLRAVAADSGTLHLLADDGLLHLQSHSGIPEPVLPKITTIPVGKGMAGLAVERREPVDACNLQTDTSGDVRPGAKATHLQGSIVVPVWRGDDVLGALGVANRSERTFTDDEIDFLTDVGRAIAATR